MIPPDFTRMSFPPSAFVEATGPFYGRRRDGRFTLGFQVEDRHCNAVGVCHGGMIATFCDMLLTVGSNIQSSQSRFLPTVSMTCDFIAAARRGAWLEGEVEVLRVTRNLLFASGLLTGAEGPIARTSGVMKLTAETDPRFHPDRYFESV
ncbi:MAG TPA: PaaI family thioesterase [Usitatibacter sp.]|nr:PaaI family thioesterase [Usitatibacter sp.]